MQLKKLEMENLIMKIILCNYENYSNNLWKNFDNNSLNWDFSNDFIQKHYFKNLIIKYDGRVKSILIKGE